VNVATGMICGSIASMPLNLMRTAPDGGKSQVISSPLYDVLKKRPNAYQTARVFRRTLTHHALNYGNGYARIVRRGGATRGEVIGLYILHPTKVQIKFDDKGAP